MLEGFDYTMCMAYRGFLPQSRIEELCSMYPHGVTGAYSLRKRLILKPYHVDEMCALLIQKMVLVEPIKGVGEMEERSRAGHGVLVLVVDPLNGQTSDCVDGAGFDGILGDYVEDSIKIWRREDIAGNPWMSKTPNLIPLPPEDWTKGERDAETIWKWWKETLWVWNTMVHSDIPHSVRAATRLFLRRQGNAGDCTSKIIACFKTFDISKTGYLGLNVLETAILWLGGIDSKDKASLSEMLQQATFTVDGTEAATRMKEFGRSRASELSLGISTLPNLTFGYIDYADFVRRMNDKKRSSHRKKSTMRKLVDAFAIKMKEKGSLLAMCMSGDYDGRK